MTRHYLELDARAISHENAGDRFQPVAFAALVLTLLTGVAQGYHGFGLGHLAATLAAIDFFGDALLFVMDISRWRIFGYGAAVVAIQSSSGSYGGRITAPSGSRSTVSKPCSRDYYWGTTCSTGSIVSARRSNSLGPLAEPRHGLVWPVSGLSRSAAGGSHARSPTQAASVRRHRCDTVPLSPVLSFQRTDALPSKAQLRYSGRSERNTQCSNLPGRGLSVLRERPREDDRTRTLIRDSQPPDYGGRAAKRSDPRGTPNPRWRGPDPLSSSTISAARRCTGPTTSSTTPTNTTVNRSIPSIQPTRPTARTAFS